MWVCTQEWIVFKIRAARLCWTWHPNPFTEGRISRSIIQTTSSISISPSSVFPDSALKIMVLKSCDTVQLLPATCLSILIQTLWGCSHNLCSKNKMAACFVVAERRNSNSCSCRFIARPVVIPWSTLYMDSLEILLAGSDSIPTVIRDTVDMKIRQHEGLLVHITPAALLHKHTFPSPSSEGWLRFRVWSKLPNGKLLSLITERLEFKSD